VNRAVVAVGVFSRSSEVRGRLQRQKYHLACYILIAADGCDHFQVLDAPTDRDAKLVRIDDSMEGQTSLLTPGCLDQQVIVLCEEYPAVFSRTVQ
jgi:hypothetical protein